MHNKHTKAVGPYHAPHGSGHIKGGKVDEDTVLVKSESLTQEPFIPDSIEGRAIVKG